MFTLKKIAPGLIIYIILTFLLSIYDFTHNTYIMIYLVCLIGMILCSSMCYLSYKRNKTYKTYYKILFISTFSYLIASIIDIYYSTYYENSFSNIFYVTCSLGLCIAVFYLVFKLSNKLELIYTFINAFIFIIFITYIAWNMFVKEIVNSIPNWNLDHILCVIFLTNAFLMLLGILILFQLCKFTKNIKLLTLGFKFYALTELVYYYFDLYNNVVIDNFLFIVITGLGWELGLLLLSSSALYITDDLLPNFKVSNADLKNNPHSPLNISISILLIISISISKNIFAPFFFVLLLIFRRIYFKYIDTYWINEKLNKDYLLINDTLLKTLEDIKYKNDELYYLANIDSLTSLPNRRHFVNYLDNIILKNGTNYNFALLFLDLDRFKSINDWYGHDMGDKLLLATSQRLKDNLGPDDFISRQGGDEFVVILNNLIDVQEAIDKSNNLIECFRQPFIIDNISINSTISIGISIYPLNSTNRSNLMKFSDIALYSAKKSGKNTSQLYNIDMQKGEIRKLELENKLYDSINNNELAIYFQPQINIKTKELIGVEALVRWNNPELGFISPGEFIPIAEDNGFIINIGNWVLDNACKKIKYINDTYNKDIKVGVNVSPKQFITSNLYFSVNNYIKKYNIKPHWLDIEITENCSIQNEKEALEKLLSLKKLGVKISVDDFGTGYSSLIYLKTYPLDTLKIALELVRDISNNKENYNIVKAIISMCNELNLNVIAEGVETKEQFDILNTLGCNEVQGYYTGKPMSLEELEEKFFNNKKRACLL